MGGCWASLGCGASGGPARSVGFLLRAWSGPGGAFQGCRGLWVAGIGVGPAGRPGVSGVLLMWDIEVLVSCPDDCQHGGCHRVLSFPWVQPDCLFGAHTPEVGPQDSRRPSIGQPSPWPLPLTSPTVRPPSTRAASSLGLGSLPFLPEAQLSSGLTCLHSLPFQGDSCSLGLPVPFKMLPCRGAFLPLDLGRPPRCRPPALPLWVCCCAFSDLPS